MNSTKRLSHFTGGNMKIQIIAPIIAAATVLAVLIFFAVRAAIKRYSEKKPGYAARMEQLP